MNKFKEDLEKCGTLPGCKQCGYLMPKENLPCLENKKNQL